MAPIEISVTGSSSIQRHPERAFLTLRVSSTGPSQATVSQEVTLRSNGINQLLNELATKSETEQATSDAPVTDFSVGFLKSWSELPHDKKGQPRERVYHAQVNINAYFRDFGKLSEVVAQLLALPNVEISGITWQLTKPTRKALGSESRKLAMLDAVERARDYADVVGREVFAVEIDDEPRSGPSAGYQMMMMQQRAPQMPIGYAGNQGEGGLDLTPQNIDVAHSVQVKFRGE